jgi:LuxR family maltose regulon positive regulatory protein
MSLDGVPRLSSALIQRPRLMGRFDDDLPLVVAHAPAGLGKTVAMTQWARATARTGVWMRVRDGNSSPEAFAEMLSHELLDAGRIDPASPFALADDALRMGADPWDLTRRALRGIGQPLTLAIDESDRLDDQTVDGIVGLVSDVPELTVRTTTRRRNRFVDAGLALVLDVDVITADDLTLTPDEAAGILGTPPDDPRVRQVLDLGGAPALARMVNLGASAVPTPELAGAISSIDAEDATGAGIAAVADSLLRLRASRWDDAFLAFMEMVSLTDGVTAPAASLLTGRDDAAELLSVAESEGLGQWEPPASPGDQPRFVLAPFLRAGLESALRRRLPANGLRRLALAVARQELAEGRPYPALRRAVENGDMTLATEVLRRHWFELFRYKDQVRALFAPVPMMTLRSLPLVAMFLALLSNAEGPTRLRALEYFALAAYGSRMQRKTAAPPDRALLSAIETAAYRVSGLTRAAGTSAKAGYDTMRSMSVEDRDALGGNLPTIYNQLGTTFFYSGDTEKALECFGRSAAAAEAGGLRSGLQGFALTAGAYALSGDMPEALAAADNADRRVWPERWKDGYAGSFLVVARAMLAIEAGDADAAEEQIRTLDPHRRTIEHWSVLAHTEVLIGLLRHEPDAALARLDAEIAEQKARHALGSVTAARLRHTRALGELARGDIAAASAALGRGNDVLTAVSRARISLAEGDPEAAMRLLGSQPARDVSSRTRAEHMALSAAAVALGGGDPEPAAVAVTRLTAQLRERQQRLALALVPAAALDALAATATAASLAPEGVQMLDRARSAALLAPQATRPRLTQREVAVATELARSETVAQIASRLSVSPNTVKSQLRVLYRKLDVGTRSEALRALSAWGFLGDALVGDDDLSLRSDANER